MLIKYNSQGTFKSPRDLPQVELLNKLAEQRAVHKADLLDTLHQTSNSGSSTNVTVKLP